LIVCFLPESLPNSTIHSCENMSYVNQISTSFSKLKEPHQNSRRRRSDTNQVPRAQKYQVSNSLTHSPTHLLTYLLTYILTITPWSRVLLEKLAGSQLVKKFPTFYGTHVFITVFTSARHLSLSRARSIQSMSPFHFQNIHLNIILPSMFGSSKWYL